MEAKEVKEKENDQKSTNVADEEVFKWGEEGSEATETHVSSDSVEQKKKVNENLSKDEVKALLKKYSAMYPGVGVKPLVIKTGMPGENRVYIIKPILTEEIDRHRDMVEHFRNEIIAKTRSKARKEWLKEKGYEEDRELTTIEEGELEEYTNQYIMLRQEAIADDIDKLAVNSIGVVFPENHAEMAVDGKVPVGDATFIHASVLTLSGWSEITLDVESMEDDTVEDIYGEI